jgi:hypothetical protein
MLTIKDSTLIALAAASLFGAACKKDDKPATSAAPAAITGSATAPAAGSSAPTPPAPEKTAATVHCGGINECKGKSLCSTAKTSCAGQNACKGQGWIDVAADDCKTKGGTVVAGMDGAK